MPTRSVVPALTLAHYVFLGPTKLGAHFHLPGPLACGLYLALVQCTLNCSAVLKTSICSAHAKAMIMPLRQSTYFTFLYVLCRSGQSQDHRISLCFVMHATSGQISDTPSHGSLVNRPKSSVFGTIHAWAQQGRMKSREGGTDMHVLLQGNEGSPQTSVSKLYIHLPVHARIKKLKDKKRAGVHAARRRNHPANPNNDRTNQSINPIAAKMHDPSAPHRAHTPSSPV